MPEILEEIDKKKDRNMEFSCEDVFYLLNKKVWTYLFCLEKIQRSKEVSISIKDEIFTDAYRIAALIFVFSDSIIRYIENNQNILLEEMGKPILNIMQLIHLNQKELLKYMKNDNVSYTEDELINRMIDENNQIIFSREKIEQMLYYKGFINNKIFEKKKIKINDEMSL